MSHQRLSRCALLVSALTVVSTGFSQDSGALITALIRKGILTNQEAEDIRADLVKESNTVPAHAFAGGKSTDRLSVGMRMQAQYTNLGTEIKGTPDTHLYTDHFLLRRMYVTMKAGVGGNWGATMTYDFANGSFDDAIIEWKPANDLSFNFGLRKVNVAYEERGSSGNLKAIERSGVTRYFVELNNGRRLGAASYRIGAFLDGKRDLTSSISLVYSAALTNPERNDTFTASSGAGDITNNRLATWGNLGLAGKFAENNGTWIAGVGYGHEPDQGGFGTANLGRGFDLDLHSVYFDLTLGRFGLMTEYLSADVERGRALTGNPNARPHGYFVQPTFLITDTWEAVVRYQWLDTDGRGVALADVIRSASGGVAMNKFTEWYGGFNWYLRGNDMKFQLGGIYGETKETVTGTRAKAKTVGVRMQVQEQF